MLKNYSFAALAATAALTSPLAAQQPYASGTRFTVEPFAGAFFGPSAHWEESGEANRPGVVAGLTLGYDLSPRARLTATAGYAAVNQFGRFGVEPRDYFVYGQNSWLLTGGGEYTVLPGRTSAALGLEAGAIVDTEDPEGVVGAPSERVVQDYRLAVDGSYAPVRATVVPRITLEHRFTPAVALRVGARDYLDLGDSPVRQRPAFTLGVAFGRR